MGFFLAPKTTAAARRDACASDSANGFARPSAHPIRVSRRSRFSVWAAFSQRAQLRVSNVESWNLIFVTCPRLLSPPLPLSSHPVLASHSLRTRSRRLSRPERPRDASPGWKEQGDCRPGKMASFAEALKGRDNAYLGPSGLGTGPYPQPRPPLAPTWAGM